VGAGPNEATTKQMLRPLFIYSLFTLLYLLSNNIYSISAALPWNFIICVLATGVILISGILSASILYLSFSLWCCQMQQSIQTTYSPGGEGVGVNISEDARHWIGHLQYNPSTIQTRKPAQLLTYILNMCSFNVPLKHVINIKVLRLKLVFITEI
jgi:hypothetical protein